MSNPLHGWYSEQCEASMRELQDIHCSVPVYLDAGSNHVRVTFVTMERELDYLCTWEDLEYCGEVFKWSNCSYLNE